MRWLRGQRGKVVDESVGEFEHRKRQWNPRSFSHVPGVLEVAHDLKELLVRLGTRADEPRLHRPDVLQRILGRLPARRDRGSHLTVFDCSRSPGTSPVRRRERKNNFRGLTRGKTTCGARTSRVSHLIQRGRARVDYLATKHSRATSTAAKRRDCERSGGRFQESRGDGKKAH